MEGGGRDGQGRRMMDREPAVRPPMHRFFVTNAAVALATCTGPGPPRYTPVTGGRSECRLGKSRTRPVTASWTGR